jgi:molybdopterin-binding protein
VTVFPRGFEVMPMTEPLRLGTAAELIGVSTDTVRRWADEGRIATARTAGGHRRVEPAELARFVSAAAETGHPVDLSSQSARNRFPGIVTRVIKDGVMAQVEVQAGRFRVVSLMTREAAEELGLEPGTLAVAAVKATNVVVEVPR